MDLAQAYEVEEFYAAQLNRAISDGDEERARALIESAETELAAAHDGGREQDSPTRRVETHADGSRPSPVEVGTRRGRAIARRLNEWTLWSLNPPEAPRRWTNRP